FDQFREKLQKEGDQQQTDVHTVHVGIGGDHDVVVPQVFKAFLDVQRRLQQVEFFIFVNNFFRKPVAVQRLPFQAENCLRVHITAFGDGTTRGITLRYEKRG